MLKNPNIHTAESSWKLNACLRCPAYFHHFNNFTIKIIFSQILTLQAGSKPKLQWVYGFLHYSAERQGFSPATWSIHKALGGVEVLMLQSAVHSNSTAGLCPQRDRPTCPCKSLHLKKPPRTDFQGDQTSNLAVSAGLFWGLIPTPQLIGASIPKAASLPRGCISLKCLVIQEQLLPCPPNPIVFLKSVGCF